MKQATTTAFVGSTLVRKGSLWEDTDALVKSHGHMFRDAESENLSRPPKIFTADSLENPPARPPREPGPQIMTAPERKKPGPKPGTRRGLPPTAPKESPSGR
jgi:hypothetical protein